MADFKDNFSKQSDEYLKYRPTYPEELFKYLSEITPGRHIVWDCGTGNGQAAVGLTKYFDNIYATDASERQIANAFQHEQISYKVEQAEKTGLKDKAADLVTVAIALHWFEFDLFYKEVYRVLKPGGIIAAWTYRLPTISPEIDEIVRKFHDEVVDEYWQKENRLVEGGYETLPFPFEKIDAPAFEMRKQWSINDLVGLVSSWSAIQRLIAKTGKDPIPQLVNELKKVWGNTEERKEVVWKLILKVGRIPSPNDEN